jgi:hypothetical protein
MTSADIVTAPFSERKLGGLALPSDLIHGPVNVRSKSAGERRVMPVAQSVTHGRVTCSDCASVNADSPPNSRAAWPLLPDTIPQPDRPSARLRGRALTQPELGLRVGARQRGNVTWSAVSSLRSEWATTGELEIPLPSSLESGTQVVKTTALAPDGTQFAESNPAGTFVWIAPPQTSTPGLADATTDNPDLKPHRGGLASE